MNHSEPKAPEPFQVWVSKYALTKGLYKVIVTQSDDMPELVREVVRNHRVYLGEGLEWHRTKEGAITRARTLQLAQISNLEKKLDKLEKMTFS